MQTKIYWNTLKGYPPIEYHLPFLPPQSVLPPPLHPPPPPLPPPQSHPNVYSYQLVPPDFFIRNCKICQGTEITEIEEIIGSWWIIQPFWDWESKIICLSQKADKNIFSKVSKNAISQFVYLTGARILMYQKFTNQEQLMLLQLHSLIHLQERTTDIF